MDALAKAFEYRKLMDSSKTMQIMRMNNLHVVLALLGTHLDLLRGPMPTAELHELIDGDLDAFRTAFDLGDRNGRSYCEEWAREGILIRRAAVESRSETYELSAEALDALRIVNGLSAPTTTVTQSRLINVTTALKQLAVESSADIQSRVVALQSQIDELENQIELLNAGKITPIDSERAVERVRDILALVEDLPRDFARLRTSFEQLNHNLKKMVLAEDEQVSDIVGEIFDGYNRIMESDEGRTFQAFYQLVMDDALFEQLKVDVANLTARPFMLGQRELASRLARIVPVLKDGAAEAQRTLARLASSFNAYVQSQDYRRDRAMQRLVRDTMRAALVANEAARPRPTEEIDFSLPRATLSIRSVSAAKLFDPEEFDAGEPLELVENEVMSLAELTRITRETEIDFAELSENVNAVLAEAGQAVSLGKVLASRPATQGLASVVGLISLVSRYGRTEEDILETINWVGMDGVVRSTVLPVHIFYQEVAP